MFSDDTTDTSDNSILDSLQQLVNISSTAADVKNKLSKAVTAPTILAKANVASGMSTTTWIMIGAVGLLVLGGGVYLLNRKAA